MLDHICSRHLYADDRMLVAWLAEDHAVVLAVGRHDRSSNDVYALLLESLELEVPDDAREKPPCCDDDGMPPVDTGIAGAIADAVDQRRRRR